MKEASGELSMTAIAVVAIAAIGVLFSTLIWPSIKANISRSTNCSQAIDCEDAAPGAKTQKCYYCKDEDCETPATVQCPVE